MDGREESGKGLVHLGAEEKQGNETSSWEAVGSDATLLCC